MLTLLTSISNLKQEGLYKFRRISSFIFIFIISINANADDYPRDWNVDVRHYKFELVLNDNNNRIEGKCTLIVYFKEDTDAFVLDLIKENDGTGMVISNLKIDGVESTFTHINDKVTITTPGGFKKGSQFIVMIQYNGVPSDGLIISKNKYGERTFFGDNYPTRARHWLPTVDHPSDKATLEWVITAPDKYEVIGNGLKIEESLLEGGKKLTRWKQSVPISTKIMVIGVSRFAVLQSGMVNNVPIESWVYPQNREDGFFDYAPAVEIVRFFDSFIGEYPYEKLANVQSKTRYGGMENASNIFYYEGSVTGKQNINKLLAHEIAHQWFGNSVTEKSWHHAWLSEGLTSYFTHLYVEYFRGIEAKKEGLRKDREKIIKYYKKNPHPIVYTSVTDYVKMLNTNTYQKGSWVMNMLRKKIGDEYFYSGMRTYYKRFRDGNVLTDDLKNVMEEISNTELDLFFDQWVYKQGHPNLDIKWKYNKSKETVDVTIVQLQDTKFDFDIELEIDGTIYSVYVNEQETKKSFTIENEPARIIADPDVWLLFEGKISKQ